MRKFLKRTVIAGAAALAIMGVAQAESTVQQLVPNVQRVTDEQAPVQLVYVQAPQCQPLGPKGGVACYK
jgi:anaerobic selenocysteine-containing dehydrogenase